MNIRQHTHSLRHRCNLPTPAWMSRATLRAWLLALAAIFSASTGVTGTAAAAPDPAGTSEQEFTSFVAYQLKTAHFQSSFREIIERIVSGSGNPARPQELETALNMLAIREKTESRGRLDIVAFLKGYTLEKLGRRKDALKEYSRAVELKGQTPLYVFRHALLLKQESRCGEAIPEFQQIAWTVKQASYEPLFLAGECLDQLGRPEEAKQMYQEAAKRNPRYGPVQKKLVAEYRAQYEKEFDPKKRADLESQIRTAYETIVQQDPTDHDAALDLADLYLNSSKNVLNAGNLARAEALAQPFADRSKFQDERAVRTVFESQRRQGKNAEARSTLEKGLAAKPAAGALLEARKELQMEEELQEPGAKSR